MWILKGWNQNVLKGFFCFGSLVIESSFEVQFFCSVVLCVCYLQGTLLTKLHFLTNDKIFSWLTAFDQKNKDIKYTENILVNFFKIKY